MGPQTDKIALFIDGANLYATAKALGFDIDYKRLLREFQSRGYLLRAFYYTAVIEDQEYSSIRPLIDWLDYNGYSVVTKATKEFVDQTGRRKVKGNMDIELAVDAMEIAEHIDQMVLFSGDGDFRSLVEAMQRRGVRVTVVSTISTQPPDGGRRAAAAGRRVPRHRRAAAQDRARPLRAGAARAAGTAPHAAIPAAQRRAPARRRGGVERGRRRLRGLEAAMSCGAAEPGRDCALCPRLEAFRQEWRRREPVWFNAPVPSFGPAHGAAAHRRPGAGTAGRQPHRASVHRRSCRRALVRHAEPLRLCRGTYAARPDDGLELVDARITNAVRCVPPENKPTGAEIATCRGFLESTIAEMPELRAIVSLGRIAHDTAVAALGARRSAVPFAHGASHAIGRVRLFDSYHCSRYNTNTGVLTTEMFRSVFAHVRAFLKD